MTKILIVDDESSFCAAISEYLSMRFPDFRIFQALNSAQAFEIIDQEKPDILILDLNLNEKLTGFDVQKKSPPSDPHRQIPRRHRQRRRRR